MSLEPPPAGRKLLPWKSRVPLALMAAVLGYCSMTASLAQALRKKAPEQAHVLAPWDGRTTASLAAKLAGADATQPQRARSDRLARLALQQDQTAVVAAATLGLNAHLRGKSDEARHYFLYSDKLSRRELKTRMWLIADTAGQNDLPAVLRNYDIALRTSKLAPNLLFPVLARANNLPEISQGLARTLSAKPAWSTGFLAYLASTGDDPAAIIRLFEAVRRAKLETSDETNAIALDRVTHQGAYELAWSFYGQLRKGVDRRFSRDPRFEFSGAHPTVFDWVPSSDEAGISTAILAGDRGGVLDFTASPGVGGVLLQQLQLLPPGKYVLEGRSRDIDVARTAHPYWVLECKRGVILGRIDVPNSKQDGGGFRGQFTVPRDCAAQHLRLIARPSNSETGLSGQIVEVKLKPEA